MNEILIRFIVGGIVVSIFAVLGDVLKPKSFAGLFGAAPSVALATLALTVSAEGAPYAAVEARSMVGGAIAFCLYACCASYVLMNYRLPAYVSASLFILLWLALALALWGAWLR